MPAKNFSASITIGGALNSTFKAAIGGAQKEITALGKTVKTLSTAQASIGKGKGIVDLAALKAARSSMTGAQAEVKRLGDEMAAAGRPTREMAEALGKAQIQAAKAKTKYDTLRKSQLEAIRAVKDATGSYRLNADTVDKLAKATERAAARMAALRDGGERLGKIGSAFRSVGSEVFKLGGIIAGAATGAAAAAFGLAKSFSEAGDEIGNTATYLGITTDALQQFRYIGKLANVDAADMDKALQKLSVRLAKTSDPSDNLREDLGRLHLGLNVTKLRAMGSEKAMIAVADAMAKTSDYNKQLNLAVALFGEKAGPRMVNVLSKGGGELRRLAARARETGNILTKEMIERAGEMDDAWDEAGETFKGIKNIIGNELAPVFIDALKEFRQWSIDNRARIKEWAGEVGKFARETLPKVIDGAVKLGESIASLAVNINSIVQATIGWNAALVAVGATMAANVLASIVTLGSAVVSATTWVWGLVGGLGGLQTAMAAVLAPTFALGAVVGATIGSLAWLGYTLWKYWNVLPDVFDEALTRIGDAIKTALNFYAGLFTSWFNARIAELKSLGETVAGFFGTSSARATPGAGPTGLGAAGAAVAATLAAPGGLPPASVNIPPPATATVSAPAGGGGSTTFTINAAPGQDPKAIAAEVDRILRERERSRRRGALND